MAKLALKFGVVFRLVVPWALVSRAFSVIGIANVLTALVFI